MSLKLLIITVVIVITATCTSMVLADDPGFTTALITMNNPVNNQKLIPNQQLIVQYTVNGVTQANPPNQAATNYPNSLKMQFRWTSNNSSGNSTSNEFTAMNSLETEALAGGYKSLVYSHKWKLPNCHFFRRYMPSEWSFSLIFEPDYPANPANDTVAIKHANATIVPLGPKQSVIKIPVDVLFNSTLMDDAHHKGC